MANRVPFCAVAVFLVLSTTAASPAAAGDLERALRARYQGVWGVILTESYSDCAGSYSNNRIAGAGVRSTAGHRFEPGELAKIDKINLKRSRIDLFATLSEPVVESRFDGPFELFDEKTCKIQLMIELPRAVVKNDDQEAVVNRISELVERHTEMASASQSELWNHRRRRSLPEDYERTLALHARWKIEQTNTAAAARTSEALETAARLAERLSDDPDYREGWVAGMAEMQDLWVDECPQLLEVRFSSHEERAPSDRRSSSSEDQRFRDGFTDGQEIVFQILIADRLRGCIRPLPPLPED